MSVKEAAETLEAALVAAKQTGGWGVSRDLADPGPRPVVVIGPPSISFEGQVCAGPTSARFLVYVVVDADDRAIERLWELVPAVAAVLDDVTDAVVVRADPTAYPVGTTELPAYEMLTEVSLQ